MKLHSTLAALAATALLATAANAQLISSELTYDGTSTDPDQEVRIAGTTGSGNNPFKNIDAVPATGTAFDGGSGLIDLTSVAPGNAGFGQNNSAGSIAVDGVVTSTDNLGTLDATLNGFSTMFTPDTVSALTQLEVFAGKVSNSGTPAGGTAELTAIISQNGVDTTRTVATGGDGNFVSYSLDFTGTTVVGGSPVTLTIAQANSSNGNFASFDSFTLNEVTGVIPEPASLGLIGLGGLTLLRRRR